MALKHSPSVVKDGLTFYYDMYNRRDSWKGEPTTNLLPINTVLYAYNNVPQNVNVTIVKTDELFQGAPIWRQTITPINATGVNQLTALNNPGIGVYHVAGGGSANQFVGFSICYRPRVVMHTTPLRTTQSNIVGHGSGDVGGDRTLPYDDGWLRGVVVWNNTVTLGDLRHWGICPRSVVLNSPIEVDWALPFREVRPDGNSVSVPTVSSRPVDQSVLDITRNHTITVNSLTCNVQGDFRFNGTTDSLAVSTINLGNGTVPWTVSAWVRPDRYASTLGQESIMSNSLGGPVAAVLSITQGCAAYWVYQNQWNLNRGNQYLIDGQHYHITWVNNANGTMNIYINGELDATFPDVTITTGSSNPMNMIGGSWAGRFMGSIPVVMRYTRALTQAEIKQNYLVHKDRVN